MELDRVIAVSTRLFAQLGFDGVTMSTIADSVGTTLSELTRVAGTKREVYLEVMRRAYESERAALEPVIAALSGGGASAAKLVDTYLDFCIDNPDIPALWMHRWMADAADVAHLEELYVRPTHEVLRQAVAPLLAPDVDAGYAVWTIVWCVHGFLTGGVSTEPGHRGRGPAASDIAAFRTHLHLLSNRLLGSPI